MIIRCSGCDTTFTFETEPPKFCQECGSSLQDEPTQVGDVAGELTEVADVTIAPTAAPVKPTRSLRAGERIENYELISILGSGGMGVVWKAVDTNNGRQVALKRLSSNHLADQDSVARFKREAQLASMISHPRVTFVYSSGRLDDQPFIAMELMPGETLEDRVKKDGPLPVGEAVDKILDVIDGLNAAHQLGLIHRDVKPSNCFVDTDDRIKVGDFGLSKSVITTDVQLTRTGTFMGTPAYAAPEQIRGAKLDHRTDIYAVGATLCNLLTGRPPFVGDAMTVTAQIVTDSPKIVGDLPRELVRILNVCLEKNPTKRYQSLHELKNALLPFAQSQDSLAAIGRRVSAYMVDAVLVAIAIGVCMGGLGGFAGILANSRGIPLEEMIGSISRIAPLFGFVVSISYYFLFESATGKTFGKKLLGLKVVDYEGAKPAWWRALIRAFFIPGGAAIPMLLLLLILYVWPVKPTAIDSTIRTAVKTLITVVPMLLILSPIIRRVSSRGWHEVISGTRVITDGRPAERQLLIPDPKPECDTESRFMLGPYRVGQILHRSTESTVYLGVDTQLNRNVWVYLTEDAQFRPSDERIVLARTARQRWLDGGISDGKRWDAFEAVEGLPLQAVTASRYPVDWPEYRQAMMDVAEELQVALKDGTLPDTLSLPQVWLDRNGHAKLIDRSLVDFVEFPVSDEDPRTQGSLDTSNESVSSNPYASPAPAMAEVNREPISAVEQSAVRLMKAVGKSVSNRPSLPLSAQTFLSELRQQPDSGSTLTWTIDKLRGFSGKLGRIDWETRVGVLGITVGFEYLLFSILSGLLFLLAYFVIPVPNPSRFFLGLIMGLIIPIALGVIFHGGFIFHMMGISVTNRKGKQVGVVKLIARSFLSWLPVVAATGAFMVMTIGGESFYAPDVEPDPGSMAADMKDNPMIIVYALLIATVSALAIGAGILISLFSPTRGLQDYLLGTRLTPK